MWSIAPEQIYKKPRLPGISGYMRLKNEAEFLDRTIETHIDGLDELIVTFNDCSDETPEICHRWQKKHPDKIKVYEYEPKVVPFSTPEARQIETRSPNSFANYSNYAMSLTNRRIVLRVDGDHSVVRRRFLPTCDYVRKHLPPYTHYPIYGLNITHHGGEIGIYNFYDFQPIFEGDRSKKIGQPPFTSGDHCFHHIDEACWYEVDRIEGNEMMDLANKPRWRRAPLTYCFFHLKGMKRDRGTGNWGDAATEQLLRTDWIRNVRDVDPRHIAALEEMVRHNPVYFRGARLYAELAELFPDMKLKQPRPTDLPPLSLRERLADLWYRIAYP
jgi:hypothetical protein